MTFQYLNFINESLSKIKGQIVGCIESEIENFEAINSVKFPLAYKEFLLIMGTKTGNFIEDCDTEIHYLIELQCEANDILKRCSKDTLAKNAFVFLTHQNYSFAMFKLDEGDNPPIYVFVEGDEPSEFTKSYESFSDFIHKELMRIKVL